MRLSVPLLKNYNRLLEEALSLKEDARAHWLEELPSEYAELIPLLKQSLFPERGSGTDISLTYLETSSGDTGPGSSATGLSAGARVGPYELIRLLGAGGMAEVWFARRADGVFRREVALKLPLLARARRELEQRFARERDILAGLEHPHIARLYDAGIDPDGLPYLSMEYIEGETLTQWCDKRKLPIRSRLQLFLQVLDAVEYAHQRHVIHRDLKPNNILVTKAGQTRLLDFGVATLLESPELTGHPPLTKVYGHAITPIYASPELVSGGVVDERSDIYSLGVVLYELLTGERPYRLNSAASRGVLEQAILAAEVPRPSAQLTAEGCALRSLSPDQLARRLRGDLDLITLKALAKNPQSRYLSVAEFARDIQYHLEGKPVIAQAPSWHYRLHKLLGRHRTATAVSAGAAAVLLLITGLQLTHTINLLGGDRGELSYGRGAILQNSIAVLPFLDLSEKRDKSYFSDGLSEELINELAHTEGLQVIARTSSFQFRDRQNAIAEIGSTLRVAHVLEGSVRRAGDAIRVSAQLIRAEDGAHLWSQNFDRDVKDIFQVQDEIADAVVAALKVKLQLQPTTRTDPHRSDDPQAYNDYLLARQLGRRGNIEDIKHAVEVYSQAIARDPNYAAAYAGLSFTRTAIATSTQDAADFTKARDAAETALKLAPQFVDAYRARSLYRMETLDFVGARRDAERAIALAPGESTVQSLYGAEIAAFGLMPQAIKAMNKAIELDPLSGYAWANIGLFLTESGDYAGARRALERAVAIGPTNDSYHFALAQLDLLEGKLGAASGEFAKQSNKGHRLMGEALLAHAEQHSRQAQQALKDLIAEHANDMAYQVADIYAWLGEKDKSFEWLERAYTQHDSGLNGIAYDPLLHVLRSDARFGALVQKLGLTN